MSTVEDDTVRALLAVGADPAAGAQAAVVTARIFGRAALLARFAWALFGKSMSATAVPDAAPATTPSTTLLERDPPESA